MKNKKLAVIGTAVLMIGAFFLGSYAFMSYHEKQLGFMASEQSELFIRDHSPILGKQEAKVYLVEFLDPECESCRAFYPAVKKIMADNPGKIKLVVRYVPFHKNSRFAIKVLEGARKQGKYWETLKLLFETQPYWGNHHNPKPELIWDFLPQAGVDVEKVKKQMDDPNHDKIIDIDFADSKKLNVRGTPTFFVNGKPLQRFGYKELKELVETEIKLVQ